MKSKKLILLVAALLSVAFTLTLHAQTTVFTHPGHVRNHGTPYPTSKQPTGNQMISVCFSERTLDHN